ncbi:cupin domain-containing protein [Pelolinea submarina]|jgi:mannose-6-phosphate isomerase-like protein (cupin superfamily)|uniref:Mannose-6-phosphate isomerase-like protein (Cupin superfamily) n=2 Tax=Pelolinea submarina TaxID=913107 RepID=A0A347ZPN0_9CHLR|nr:cupin domain-containing protein [Pelolinea submarina]REG04724.1 mannose-6-phosphate isomerase-like protein (cupin superfamily) [Pelolinea submarina]BBB47261.1 glucose-6-phosphate isomerase, archaeal [Pelolinea submarina]
MNVKPMKVNPYEVEPIILSQRINYKLIDPTTVGSKNLTFGMVVVEPEGICEPGHDHEEQEEIFFCLSGEGVVLIGDDKAEWNIKPNDAVFIPPHTYHNLKNPYKFPLCVLWIQSPAGWVFDKHPDLKKLAEKGVEG